MLPSVLLTIFPPPPDTASPHLPGLGVMETMSSSALQKEPSKADKASSQFQEPGLPPTWALPEPAPPPQPFPETLLSTDYSQILHRDDVYQ